MITDDNRPIVRLFAVPDTEAASAKRRLPGTARGQVLHMAPDFDEPLHDFREYM